LLKLKNNTRYKSNISLRPVLSYILKFLSNLDGDRPKVARSDTPSTPVFGNSSSRAVLAGFARTPVVGNTPSTPVVGISPSAMVVGNVQPGLTGTDTAGVEGGSPSTEKSQRPGLKGSGCAGQRSWCPLLEDFNVIKNAIIATQPKFPLKTRVHFIMIFICFVLEDTKHLENFKIYKKTIHHDKNTKIDYDQHRISKEELESMYESSKSCLRDQTMFLLMITTGMRAHGVSNIKLSNICTIINNIITINKTGRTIEKGNKWFTFSICDNLSELLHKYINTERKSNSSYLFSGRGEDIGISTNRINSIIKNIANKAGIKGPHIHAHSIRHSFAHILLESGNKPEMVSKMLGHSNTQTTEQYYLKESAVEVAKRANIPWLVKTSYDPVPNFMNTNINTNINTNVNTNANKKPNRKEKNAILKMLNKDFQKI
jgi:integrase